jgi:DNA-binding phage protein
MPKKKKGAPDVVEQLREAVRGSGRSLTQLGKDSGVPVPSLSRFMKGERTLTLPAVSKLCDTLGLQLAKVRRRPTPREEG